MAKINFTDEHLNTLKELISEYVINDNVINGPMGQQYNIVNLMHDLSLNSLRTISLSLTKKRDALSVNDEWTENTNLDKIEDLNKSIKLISLIIGYKLKQEELFTIEKEREKIQSQIDELTKASKSPQELIADLQSKLAELE